MKNLLLLCVAFSFQWAIAQTPCVGGMAGPYPCNGYDLQSHIPLSTFNSSGANDSWGWTDPIDGKEYVLMGLEDGTAFIDISDPVNPVYLGKLPTQSSSITWRDMKVYNNHAFVVSEAFGHGMQIFDLTHLRNVTSPPVTFSADAVFNDIDSAHNIVINEDTGFAYTVGGDTYGGGAHFIDISDPLNPVSVGGYSSDGYVHDAQVVTYNGPDSDYTGREIFIGSNGSDQVVSIVDVTDKNNPVGISTISYSNVGYTHQGWFTEDQTYFLIGDEFDESNVGFNTRTIVFDLTDLDNPVEDFEYFGTTPAIDHNGYVIGDNYYLANYAAGLRVIDVSDISNGNMNEVAFFDTYTSDNNASYNGVWNVYPYFGSGNIMINDRSGGFFLVKASAPDNVDPVAVCQDYTASLDSSGQVIVDGTSVDGGSSDDSGFYTITLSQNTFDCSELGDHVVTVTVTDPAGNTDTCSATITVVDDSGASFNCYTDSTVQFDNDTVDYYTLPDYVSNGDVTATDNCSSVLAISQDPVAGTQMPEGVHVISFETTDDEGNTASCSFQLTVEATLGTEDLSFAQGVSIAPNPTQGTISIHSEFENITRISVVGITGKRLMDLDNVNLSTTTMDVSGLSNGIYFVVLNDKLTKKIIKQ